MILHPWSTFSSRLTPSRVTCVSSSHKCCSFFSRRSSPRADVGNWNSNQPKSRQTAHLSDVAHGEVMIRDVLNRRRPLELRQALQLLQPRAGDPFTVKLDVG